MDSKDVVIRNSTAEFLIFQKQTGGDDIEIKYQDGTLWLTQKMIANLFEVNIPAISKHLQNIYESFEIEKSSTISKMETVQVEGNRKVTRLIEHYNLDAVISVGYRVNSVHATQFRRWATSVLSKFAKCRHYINGNSKRTCTNRVWEI